MTRDEMEARRAERQDRENIDRFLRIAADPMSVYHHKIDWDAPEPERREQARKQITVTVTVRRPAAEPPPKATERQAKLAEIAPLLARAHVLSDVLLNAWGEWETSTKPKLEAALGPGFTLDIDDLAAGDFEFDAGRILDHVQAQRSGV
jgi:hypothetical protein